MSPWTFSVCLNIAVPALLGAANPRAEQDYQLVIGTVCILSIIFTGFLVDKARFVPKRALVLSWCLGLAFLTACVGMAVFSTAPRVDYDDGVLSSNTGSSSILQMTV